MHISHQGNKALHNATRMCPYKVLVPKIPNVEPDHRDVPSTPNKTRARLQLQKLMPWSPWTIYQSVPYGRPSDLLHSGLM